MRFVAKEVTKHLAVANDIEEYLHNASTELSLWKLLAHKYLVVNAFSAASEQVRPTTYIIVSDLRTMLQAKLVIAFALICK